MHSAPIKIAYYTILHFVPRWLTDVDLQLYAAVPRRGHEHCYITNFPSSHITIWTLGN